MIAAFLSFFLRFYDQIADVVLVLLIVFIALLVWRSVKLGKIEQHKIMVLGSLLLFSAFFWALYFQSYLSVTLFIDRAVNRNVFGVTIPTAMFQGLLPAYIILFSPLVAQLWIKLEKKKSNPSGPLKFALGILLIGCAFLTLALAARLSGPFEPISAGWLILTFFLQTMGELMLSPTGLAMVTKLAPANWMSMMMGLWFMSLAAGNALAGKLADFTDLPAILPAHFPITQFYGHTFFKLGCTSVAIAILLVLCIPLFNKLIPNSEVLS